jgi:predicted DNA repair protein MutK
MLWVGGGILVHGLHEYHLDALPDLVEKLGEAAGVVPAIGGVTRWLATATASALVGLVVGGAIAMALHLLPKRH